LIVAIKDACITMFVLRMISMQIAKMGIVANLPISIYFHANYITTYYCKVHVYDALKMDFHAK
jgi:hypothetical protein